MRERGTKVARDVRGSLQVSNVVGDVRKLHTEPRNARALFQVASQFNLLEMTGPQVTPGDGVTRYELDHTQGPACAIAAGAATIYRNYFAPVDGQIGQTRARQIDCLRGIGAIFINEDDRLWKMQNGYALCTREGLRAIAADLAAWSDEGVEGARAALRIGLHWNVQVTDHAGPDPLYVSQAFCSALPVAYSDIPPREWEPFARLVLEAAYEATLWAGVINASERGSNLVFLTSLGGGAFGNDRHWIEDAMARAFRLFSASALDIRVVRFR